MLDRRTFVKGSAVAVGGLAMGPAYWRRALAAAPTTPGPGPYGPPGAPDASGVAVPAGFTARAIATAGSPVGATGYVWPPFPDGKATFRRPDGGWVLAVNSEVPGQGGASSITFGPDGQITGARSILTGTSTNCGGGATPWGTWLSCEEVDAGRVWECDPLGVAPAVVRPALGVFTHEAAVVDPVGRRVYMTEDEGDSGFYRFTPDAYPDLSRGTLEIAAEGAGGPLHQSGTELAGTTFDPDGRRLYFSSQRGGVAGITYEVTGPFRTVEPRRTITGGSAADAARALGLRAKPAARAATVRRDGLAVGVDLEAGAFALRLLVGSTAVAGAGGTAAGGTQRVRLAPRPAAARVLRTRGPRRTAATLELRQGGRTVTRPIVLTRPG